MSLSLEIIVPDGVLVQAAATAVQAADASGSFGLLRNHEPFLTVLAPGVLTYRDAGGREHYVAVDGGVLLMEENHVSVVTRDAATADQLEDVAATATRMIERREVEEQEARTAFGELEAALRRALSRAERG